MINQEQFYFSEKCLAIRWGMSFRTLAGWRCKGSGPPYMKIGGRIRYSLDNIKKFEEENWHQSKGVNPYSCNKDLSKI